MTVVKVSHCLASIIILKLRLGSRDFWALDDDDQDPVSIYSFLL